MLHACKVAPHSSHYLATSSSGNSAATPVSLHDVIDYIRTYLIVSLCLIVCWNHGIEHNCFRSPFFKNIQQLFRCVETILHDPVASTPLWCNRVLEGKVCLLIGTHVIRLHHTERNCPHDLFPLPTITTTGCLPHNQTKVFESRHWTTMAAKQTLLNDDS